ncbi:ABC transporter ATP-binding protein [Garicola koreensis]|uniref:ABC transporter ATP-binding protein n=1 Tax=Garicola koreensis TaxID=1262554 RepID=UPI0031EEEB79
MTNPMMNPVLTGHGLLKTYGSVCALAGADLSVHAGESVAVMGPSGSGKTTLMHVLSGIITPDEGQVQLRLPDGEDVALSALNAEKRARLRRAHIGFVFQEGLLLPELSAVENTAVPLMLAGVNRGAAEAAATQWLGRLGLAGMELRRPAELSGGQAQRVAIARAQVAEPPLVFADEPTGALDSATSQQVLDALLESAAQRGAALVVVTHDSEVATRCSRLVQLEDGHVVHDSARQQVGAA